MFRLQILATSFWLSCVGEADYHMYIASDHLLGRLFIKHSAVLLKYSSF